MDEDKRGSPTGFAPPAGAEGETEAGGLAPRQVLCATQDLKRADRVSATLRQLITHFGAEYFTYTEAQRITGQGRGVIMQAMITAQRNGWMPVTMGKRYRFQLERIPPHWRGENNDGQTEFAIAVKLLRELFSTAPEFGASDIDRHPAFRGFHGFAAGVFLERSLEEGHVERLPDIRGKPPRFRVKRQDPVPETTKIETAPTTTP